MQLSVKKMICLFLICVLLPVTLFMCAARSPDTLTLHMLDVGQGDSFLIVTPSGYTMLVDAGDPTQGGRVASYLKRQGVNRINHVVATHPHADHIGGMEVILDRLPVDELLMPPVVHTSQIFERLLLKAAATETALKSVSKSAVLHVEDNIIIQVLTTGYDYGDHLNDWSLIIHISHGAHSILMTGDAEAAAEAHMLEVFPPQLLNATVLKVGHHGSSTSTTLPFLRAVSPEIALISSGRNNRYGHPNEEVLSRLEAHKSWIYRTDLQGTVVIFSDGETIWSHQAPYNMSSDIAPVKVQTQ
jgi:competence protein ComEC